MISFSDLYDDSSAWVAASYTASIDWGDGSSPTAGDVALNSDGTYSVYDASGHIYDHAGSYLVSVTVDGTRNGIDSPVTFYRTASVLSGMTGSGTDLTSTQGTSTGGVTVATFVDPDPTATAADYTAYIDWGDGSAVERGTVSVYYGDIMVSSAGHVVRGTGDVRDAGVPGGSTGRTANAYGTVTVSPGLPPGNLNALGCQLADVSTGVAGTATLATFTDVDTALSASAFAAQVDWGDGSEQQLATVTGSGGHYLVQGEHDYAAPGDYAVEVVITGPNGSATTMTTAVVREDMTATPRTWTLPTEDLLPNPDAPPNMLLETFTDANLATTASDYTALVDWGDGTSSHAYGTVAGSGGQFTVSGSHGYSAAGVYAITVYLYDELPGAGVLSSTVVETQISVTVADAAAGKPVPSRVLGWTMDGNEYDPEAATNMTATLDWGDPIGGSPGTPELDLQGNGVYAINSSAYGVGGHTYTSGGTYTLSGTTTEDRRRRRRGLSRCWWRAIRWWTRRALLPLTATAGRWSTRRCRSSTTRTRPGSGATTASRSTGGTARPTLLCTSIQWGARRTTWWGRPHVRAGRDVPDQRDDQRRRLEHGHDDEHGGDGGGRPRSGRPRRSNGTTTA